MGDIETIRDALMCVREHGSLAALDRLAAQLATVTAERDEALGKFDRLRGWRETVEPELERLRARVAELERAADGGVHG